MPNQIKSFINSLFINESYSKSSHIQSLWSGYGSIDKWSSINGDSIIVKHIKLPTRIDHPHGWNSDVGHKRKIQSYKVEQEWYLKYVHLLNENCRIPKLLGESEIDGEMILVLEDLDKSGYPIRLGNISELQIHSCVRWLANLHGQFISHKATGLWDFGSYWCLATRQEELDRMEDSQLKAFAKLIDFKLNECKFQTILHGDAKVANFCFSKDESKVAAVDFQYVGKGCGMKDLIYFMSSCLDGSECEKKESEILEVYFKEINNYLPSNEAILLEKEWRSMYKYAWADFNRFLKGWSPGHWKMNDYVEEITKEVLDELKQWN
jgi:hypothetical protein|tara:strand:- start:2645 stop:3610 length:966 start_codon:yes stop_codon:yes gene_type:complete